MQKEVFRNSTLLARVKRAIKRAVVCNNETKIKKEVAKATSNCVLYNDVKRNTASTRRGFVNALLAFGSFAALSAPAYADTAFTNFAFPGTGSPTSRTMPARIADIFNVKEYGAVGNGVTNDTAAIQATFTAMWQSTYKGSTLFFPSGNYITSSGTGIDIGNHEIGSNYNNGRIIGSSRESVYINGAVNNGFIFYQDNNVNGPSEISNLTLGNTSDWIGSGALRISTSSVVCNSCKFQGMINVLGPSDIFDAAINNCTGEPNSHASTGHNGTLGVAGSAFSIKNWRSTSKFMTWVQCEGADSICIDACTVENCVTALLLGMHTGWASSCTFAPDGANPGFSIMTVGGTIGSSTRTQFAVNQTVFAKGLALPAWGSDPNDATGGVTITALISGTGYAGTYRVSGTYTIATPVPIWTEYVTTVTNVAVRGVVTEACYHTIYINYAGACTIDNCGCGSTVIECVDQFGVEGFTPRASLYLRNAAATSIRGFGAGCVTYYGSIVIHPDANISNVTFDSCIGDKHIDSPITGSISGDVLTVTVFDPSGTGVGVGMSVTGAGITAGTIITGNHISDPTLTGIVTTGTYRVNNSQTVGSEAMVVHTGADFVMPTANASKAGLRFINCNTGNMPAGIISGLDTLAMTYTCLPGEVGASSNVTRYRGQSFFIVDAAKSGGGTAAPGDIVQASGTQQIPVFFDGTNWRYGGAGQFTELKGLEKRFAEYKHKKLKYSLAVLSMQRTNMKRAA